jgi:hypothetical protein
MKRLILTVVLGLGLSLPAMAQAARLPQPIYFWGSVIAPVNAPYNFRVIRPSTIGLFRDGSWYVDHLHWTGWGSSVAQARGISNASNGIPNQAQGKRIKTPAQVTLSNPGRFQGHEVYRCFQLTVPAFPASDQHLCLKRSGGYWWLTSTVLSLTDFLSPDRKIWCVSGGGIPGIPFACGTKPAAETFPVFSAELSNDGKVTICFITHLIQQPGHPPDACFENWDTRAPVLKVGQETEQDGVLCKSETNGITCTLTSGRGGGKGFLINSKNVKRVGP